jgi:hypothetical protein
MHLQRWSRGMCPLILNVRTRWECMFKYTLWPIFPPGKRADAHCSGGWVGSKAGLYGGGEQEHLSPTGVQTLALRARGELPCRLSYPGYFH